MKIKNSNARIKSKDVKEIEFKFFKFNFSFIHKKYTFEDLEKEDLIELVDRLMFLSNRSITDVSMLGKENGFEMLYAKDFKKVVKLPPDFNETNRAKNAGEKFMVIRLYPNNNPRPVRIIGKFCSPIFYVFYVDREHAFLK